MSQVIRELYTMDKRVEELFTSVEYEAATENRDNVLKKVKDVLPQELFKQLINAVSKSEEEFEIHGYELGFKLGLNLGIEVSK